MLKKIVERKKYSYIINILKKSVKVTTITWCILDVNIKLIIGELLVLAPIIKKLLIKFISENGAI